MNSLSLPGLTIQKPQICQRDVIDKLKIQQQTFGNPSRIIADNGSAFTSSDFNEYCWRSLAGLLYYVRRKMRGRMKNKMAERGYINVYRSRNDIAMYQNLDQNRSYSTNSI